MICLIEIGLLVQEKFFSPDMVFPIVASPETPHPPDHDLNKLE
jgi:hypothetical protein